jgi:DNA-binding transcriptional regulator YiaG
MTPDAIRALRRALGEDVATFGARFARSGRTVENWEQGHRRPDALAQRELARLARRLKLTPARSPA